MANLSVAMGEVSYRSGASAHLAPAPGEDEFRCDDCDKVFSPGALKLVVVGRTELHACPICGHGVRKAVEGRVVVPFVTQLSRAFAFPLRDPAAVVAVGVAATLAAYVQLFGRWLAMALVVGYGFAIVRKTSVGGDRAPEAVDFSSLSELFAPLMRYMFVVLGAGVPAVIALIAQAAPAVTITLAVLGVLYVPAGMIVASESDGVLVNPFAALAIVQRIPGPYVVLLAFLAVVVAVGAGVSIAGDRLQTMLTMIPLFPRLVATTIGLYAPFTAARMLGLLVREHAEELV